MHPNVNKDRKRREARKLKKLAFRRQMASVRAAQQAADELRKQGGFRISARDWFRDKWNRIARFIKRTHASIEQGKTEIQRQIIAAAIAKRERKALDIRGMRFGGGIGRVS